MGRKKGAGQNNKETQQKQNGSSNANNSSADNFKEQGNQALKQQNFQKAIELYTKAIEIDGNNHIYFNNRSVAYFELKQYDQSLEDAQKALIIAPTYVKAYNRKGCALRELDRLEEALQTLIEGQKLDSENEEITKNIESLRGEINRLNIIPPDHPEKVRHQRMIDWLSSGGAQFTHLKMQFYEENYRGVHARLKISDKQPILFVPKSHLITLEMAKQTEVSKRIIESKIELLSPKHSFLSTYLLQERCNPDSFWRPYLDILPSNYNQFPIFFGPDDLEWLAGSPFQIQVQEKKHDIEKDYKEICRVAPQFSSHTFEDFCWARMTASSRIFGLNIDEQKTDAFVPLADMLNHRRPKQTSWSYNNEKAGFIIESMEEIERGEQVFDSYGKKCNSRFFLNYGFIVLDNDANEVAVCVHFDKDDPTLKRKEEMMQVDRLDSKNYRILENYEEQNSLEFMGYVRFAVMRDPNLLLKVNDIYEAQQNAEQNGSNGAQGPKAYKPQKTPPASIENEIEMWMRIYDICFQLNRQYKTTLEEDRRLLQHQSHTLTLNQKNCVLLRSGEKEDIKKLVLQHDYVKYANYINKVIIAELYKKKH